jgi:hypothetical protein
MEKMFQDMGKHKSTLCALQTRKYGRCGAWGWGPHCFIHGKFIKQLNLKPQAEFQFPFWESQGLCVYSIMGHTWIINKNTALEGTMEHVLNLVWNTTGHRSPCKADFQAIQQELTDIFCEGPNTKYFRLCGPYSLSQLLDSATIAEKQQ